MTKPSYEELTEALASALMYIADYGGEVTASFAAGETLAHYQTIVKRARNSPN